MTVALRDNPDEDRYEIAVDGRVAGYSEYRSRPGLITFTHTLVEPAYEGQGLGSRLARYVLDDARRRGLMVRPVCPFIRAYIEGHDEYQDLVSVRPAS
jgi:uncharacterized protein